MQSGISPRPCTCSSPLTLQSPPREMQTNLGKLCSQGCRVNAAAVRNMTLAFHPMSEHDKAAAVGTAVRRRSVQVYYLVRPAGRITGSIFRIHGLPAGGGPASHSSVCRSRTEGSKCEAGTFKVTGTTSVMFRDSCRCFKVPTSRGMLSWSLPTYVRMNHGQAVSALMVLLAASLLSPDFTSSFYRFSHFHGFPHP